VIPDFDAYCDFVAQLPENFSSIERSTLTVYTIGTHVAEVEGQVFFSGDYILSVWELLDFAERKISSYSYAVDRTENDYGGTIHNRTRMTLAWYQLTHIINISIQILNTIGLPHQKSRFQNPISHS
jgi:hypothetical protein